MHIAIIGGGSWGSALALTLNSIQHQVRCYTIEQQTIDDITQKNENSRYLPGVKIPASIKFTMNLDEALQDVELIVSALPSQITRQVIPDLTARADKTKVIWVSVAKGIENGSLLRMSQVIEEAGQIPAGNIVVLSGPSHAEEVSRNIPTAVVAASANLETATRVQQVFMTPSFRVYANADIKGVEIGGALKNIIALAAGICDGAGFGDNTKAALMTRGLVEISRLGVMMGAQAQTFAGLSGMGDLIVTCMSRHSRNRHVGEELGKGRKLSEILNEMVQVAEGVKTSLSAYELSKKFEVEMPITHQIYQTLFEDKSPHQAMIDLMTRASKIEDWG
jgi:glycerol-3-phosphate dehydrogenase (NAD(P)+)